MPLRFDRAELPAPTRTPEGWLRAPAIVARPGIYVYPQPNGKQRRELVTPEVLAQSAQGLADIPVTLRHPTDKSGRPIRVNADNVKELGAGHSRESVSIDDEGNVHVPLTVTRADAIKEIDGGMRGISPLYDATLDETPGVHPKYGAYDAAQTSRTYNSIAVCPLGRGGPVCHLRADDSEAMIAIEGGAEAEAPAEAPAAEAAPPASPAAEPAHEASEADVTALALAAILARLGVASVEEAKAKLDSEWTELYAKRDALNALICMLQCDTADAAKAKLESLLAPPAEPAAVRADSVEARAWFHRRAKLHAAAIAAKVPNPDDLDDAALCRAVVLARQPSLRADASDAFYEAAFELAAPVDHLAALRLPGKPASPEIRADSEPAKPSTNRWNDVFNAVPARS